MMTTIIGLLGNGTHCIISANDFSNAEIVSLSVAAYNGTGHLTIRNSKQLDATTIVSSAMNKNKNVTFDFSQFTS